VKAKTLEAFVQKVIDRKTSSKHFGGDIMLTQIEALIEVIAPFLEISNKKITCKKGNEIGNHD